MATEHETVLLKQAVDNLVLKKDGFYIDGTFGRGGHSEQILKKLGATGRLLVIDKDPSAIAEAERMASLDERVLVQHGSFAGLGSMAEHYDQVGKVSGVLLDLGVSSPQLDDATRGFSFTRNGPLDMRMNTREGMSAAQWLAAAEESEIAFVLREYGEERFARRIARAIVAAREESSLETTGQLAEIVAAANPSWEKHKHPATRAFQAIRIHINQELADIEQALDSAIEVLEPGGRLVVISFHSLEDRMVKRFMRRQSRGQALPASVPVMEDQQGRRLRLVGKAQRPAAEEVNVNPRARSAVMRVAEKIA
jgi:16S rRNA (cytosine1402-N4)-methyltransferase